MAKNFNFLKGTASGKVGETYYRQHGTYHRSDMSQSPKRLPYQKDDTDTAGGDCVVYMRIQKQHNNATQKDVGRPLSDCKDLPPPCQKPFGSSSDCQTKTATALMLSRSSLKQLSLAASSIRS